MVESSASSLESEQRESQAQFRELMAHLQQVFWVKNAAETAVLYVSPAYETIWGRTRLSLYDNSCTFLDSIHPDDCGRMAEVMRRKHETKGYNEEYRILRPDGTTRWIWARTYPVRDEDGAIKRYAGIAEDISERKWAEKERSRLAAIIEHADDAIISITLEGIIIAWNQGAERKYGYTAEEIIGRSIFILIPPSHCEEYLEVMKRVRKGELVPAYETVRSRKDGTLINFSVGISPIEARDGDIVGVSKISQDISRVKKLEAQLIEAQKMEVLGHLTGGVAHDFNNILAIVMGYSEIVMKDMKVGDPLRHCASAIHRAAQRGAGITRQLLVFGRRETVQPVVLDLNEVLIDLEGMLLQLINEGIELTVKRGVSIGHIRADAGYMGQVLMNLVINARDAMPRGGKLSIATSDVRINDTNMADHHGLLCGDYVVLSISDTGIGMSDEIKARLFEPFFTTKPKGKGTGLGLTTCRTIVNESHGHLAVISEVGKGTTFKIYFPRIAEEHHFTTQVVERETLPRGTETLLVVEDDPAVRRLLCVVLQGQGYQVLEASNGEDGLHAMSNNQGPAIRLVITDVIMPQMDGVAMAESMKSGASSPKILFTSGYLDDTVANHGVFHPGIAFLPKPYSIGTLARKVRELIGSL